MIKEIMNIVLGCAAAFIMINILSYVINYFPKKKLKNALDLVYQLGLNDDEIVQNEAVFFNKEKIIGIFIASCLSFILSFIFLCRVLIYDVKTITAISGVVVFALSFLWFILFCIIFIDTKDCDAYSKEQLIDLKDEYEQKRQDVLKEHKYNFSIFKGWDYIDTEILCDTFYVDNMGRAYIVSSDSDFIFNEHNFSCKYHHIVDNSDGHTLTVKELKEKYLLENSNVKSPKNEYVNEKVHDCQEK